MKYFFKTILIVILLITFNTEVNAQIEDHYHSLSGNIYIPIIVDRQEVIKFNDGRIKDRKSVV